MININLLPWRQQEREAKKKLFNIYVMASIFLAIFLLIILNIYYLMQISIQDSRNSYLTLQINKENKILNTLEEQKKLQSQIDQELNFVAAMREKSFAAVRALDELVRIIPEGIVLSKISKTNKTIMLDGKARSNLEVTQLMKNIDKSAVFFQPDLSVLGSDETTAQERSFALKIIQSE